MAGDTDYIHRARGYVEPERGRAENTASGYGQPVRRKRRNTAAIPLLQPEFTVHSLEAYRSGANFAHNPVLQVKMPGVFSGRPANKDALLFAAYGKCILNVSHRIAIGFTAQGRKPGMSKISRKKRRRFSVENRRLIDDKLYKA